MCVHANWRRTHLLDTYLVALYRNGQTTSAVKNVIHDFKYNYPESYQKHFHVEL
jgi:hypothetical protein